MKSRNRYELELMRKSGKIASSALKKAIEAIKTGVSELEVDKAASEEIYKLGGDLSYKSVPGYKYATCITVNEQVVHGIPTERKFETGDLVSVDLAVVYKGWHTDCAWSKLVGHESSVKPARNALQRMAGGPARNASRSEAGGDHDKERFLKIGEEALWDGVSQAVCGKRIGDISYAIQSKVEGAGYHIVRSLVGHGVGRSLHEDPEIPGFGNKGAGPILKQGMTLAIEVIYTKGTSEVSLSSDRWTISSADGSWGGLFEMSVIVERGKAEVLTNWRKV